MPLFDKPPSAGWMPRGTGLPAAGGGGGGLLGGGVGFCAVGGKDRPLTLCLALASPRLPPRSRSAGRGGVAAVALHVAVVSIVVSLAAWSRSSARPPENAKTDAPQMTRLVFLLPPRPGGGARRW